MELNGKPVKNYKLSHQNIVKGGRLLIIEGRDSPIIRKNR
jgi:hypothetical protein